MTIATICRREVDLRSGLAREENERVPIRPPQPRPVFLAHGTPGMQQPIAPR